MTIIDILLDSLSKQEEKLGKDSDYVAKTCQQLGEFYIEEEQYDLASNYFLSVLWKSVLIFICPIPPKWPI